METWLKDQCIIFLRVRGLDCSGTRDDLCQKIKDLNSQEDGPPPIIVSNGCSVVYLHRCLTSLLSMVSVAMSKEANKHTVVALDHKVKAFLSFFHVFQEVFKTTSLLKGDQHKNKTIMDNNKTLALIMFLLGYNILISYHCSTYLTQWIYMDH